MGYMYLVKMYYNSNSINREKMYHMCLERAQRALKPYIIPVPGVADPPIPKNLQMSFEYLAGKVRQPDPPAQEQTSAASGLGLVPSTSQAPAAVAPAAAPPGLSQGPHQAALASLPGATAPMLHPQAVPPVSTPDSVPAMMSAPPVRLAPPQPVLGAPPPPTIAVPAPQHRAQKSASAQPQQQVEAGARAPDTGLPNAAAPNTRVPAGSSQVPGSHNPASHGQTHIGAEAALGSSGGPSEAPATQAPPLLPGAGPQVSGV